MGHLFEYHRSSLNWLCGDFTKTSFLFMDIYPIRHRVGITSNRYPSVQLRHLLYFYLRSGRTYFSSLTVFLCYGTHLAPFFSGAEFFLCSPLCNSSSEDQKYEYWLGYQDQVFVAEHIFASPFGAFKEGVFSIISAAVDINTQWNVGFTHSV